MLWFKASQLTLRQFENCPVITLSVTRNSLVNLLWCNEHFSVYISDEISFVIIHAFSEKKKSYGSVQENLEAIQISFGHANVE